MKKVLLVVVMTVFTLVVGAQEKWQITKISGVNVKSSELFLIIDEERSPLLTSKGLDIVGEYKVIHDDGKLFIFEISIPAMDMRYSLYKRLGSPNKPLLKFQSKDTFTGEITAMLYTVKQVKI